MDISKMFACKSCRYAYPLHVGGFLPLHEWDPGSNDLCPGSGSVPEPYNGPLIGYRVDVLTEWPETSFLRRKRLREFWRRVDYFLVRQVEKKTDRTYLWHMDDPMRLQDVVLWHLTRSRISFVKYWAQRRWMK